MRLYRLIPLGLLASLTACGGSGNADPGLGNQGTVSVGGTKGSGGTHSAGGSTSSPTGAGGGTHATGGAPQLMIDGGAPTMPMTGSDCMSGPDDDMDMDGWTANQGDCNDCDPNVNPGAIDVLQNDASGTPLPDAMQVDSNCDGVKPVAGADLSCDGSIPVGGVADPFDAAKAMGLCNVMVPEAPADLHQKTWGVITAQLSDIVGAPFSSPPHTWAHTGSDLGILDNFGSGTPPQEGARIFGLSSGVARTPAQPGFLPFMCDAGDSIDKGYPGELSMVYADGFPKKSSCGSPGGSHDGIALDLQIRVPTNAHAMTFDFRFFTCEYPEYVCDTYNDVFAVLMAPDPLPAGDPMGDSTNSAADIAFDSMKNTIGVNNTEFLTSCTASKQAKQYMNCAGEGDLAGTNFEGHAGSAWLRSQVPVPPGQEITLRIAIWDSSDGLLDSTAVVDNFQWIADPGSNAGMTTTTVIPPSGPHK